MIGGAAATAAGVGLMSMASGGLQATAQLKAAIEASGETWGDYKDRIDAAIASGREFAHDDEDTMAALAKLTLATDSTSEALDHMQLVTDLAAQKHISLEESAGLVAKILSGSGGRTLTQYGITMEKNADGTANVQKAIDQLSAKLNGQAKASMSGFSSQVDIVRTKVVDWAEDVAGVLGPALTAIGPIVSIVGIGLDLYKTRQLAAATATIAAAAATEVETVAQVGLNTAMSANPIGIVIAALGALAAVITGGILLSGTKDLSAATADYTATLDANTGAITGNTRAMAAKALLDSGALKAAQDLGISGQLVIDATLGVAGAQEELAGAVEKATAASVAQHDANTDVGASAVRAAEAYKNQKAAIALLTGSVEAQSHALKNDIVNNNLMSTALGGTNAQFSTGATQAREYADSLNRIPGNVHTTVTNSASRPKVTAHAAGGVFTKPTLGIIGESGPEKVIPLNAGRTGGEGGGTGTLNVSVNVSGLVTGTSAEVGKHLGTILINAFKNGNISKTEFGRAIAAI
jgi:hypothetical protein